MKLVIITPADAVASSIVNGVLPVAQQVPPTYTHLFAAAPAMQDALRVLIREHSLGRNPLARDWTQAAKALVASTGETYEG